MAMCRCDYELAVVRPGVVSVVVHANTLVAVHATVIDLDR